MSFDIDPAISDLNPRVVPIRGNSKGPSIKGWTDIQDRVDDWLEENKGDLHFEEDEYHRYGIVLDEDMVIVDIDCHDGAENGYESLNQIVKAGGPDVWDQAGLVVLSPSGGRHLFFKKDPSIKIPKSSKAFPAIDLLSKGAQVIGAGSNHVQGGKYKVETWKGELTTLGEEFFSWFRPHSKPSADNIDFGDQYGDRMGGETPRDSFDRSTEAVHIVKSAMEAQGYVFHDKGDHYSYTRPNKTDASFAVSGTLGRINTNGKPFLKNFSTSDANFEPESYSLSEAYKKVCRMDDAELLRDLESQGYAGTKLSEEQDYIIQGFLESLGKGLSRKEKKKASGAELEKQYPTFTLKQMRAATSGGKRREWLIEGLLRRGEVCNIIASPKVGKSWLVYNIALAVTCGREFLGYKADKPLKVLIVDNELHMEELTWRVGQVADALKCDPEDRLQFNLLRGSNVDIDALDSKLDECGGSQYDIIVIDAFYRILPKGMSENDNASMTQIYNKLDGLASKNEASIINIHHSSKGNQGDKGVTDVGAGAGAISRAADTHMVIREHVEEKHVVIEAVTRSGLSPAPVTAEFQFPLWHHKPDMEPTVKNFENARDKMHADKKDEIAGRYEVIAEWIGQYEESQGNPPNSTEIFEACRIGTWPSNTTFQKHLKKMADQGILKELPKAAGSLAKRFTKR